MRKVLLILILIFLSCEKDISSVHCWYCETSTIGGIVIKFEVDSLTYEEILIYQRGFDDGVEYFIKGHVETICIKKED